MSMSKYNLYNLSRLSQPNYKVLNFFQQKWKSKSALRDYHGEQVREKQWERMFSRRLRSVVPMNPAYLAGNDGRNESAGRGSGLEKKDGKTDIEHTPYMLMTFAPLERRLDVAIFRALFASSARQARQFVVHGAVKVNGKVVSAAHHQSVWTRLTAQMRYPGYFLNPGDMFQVDPERVMYALGQPKGSSGGSRAEAEETEDIQNDETEAEAGAEASEPSEVDIEREPREVLKDLMSQAKSILEADKDTISGKRKQDLRAFSKAVRKMLSRSGRETIMTDSLEAQFQEIQNQLQIQREAKEGTPAPSSPPSQTQAQASTPTQPPEGMNFLTASDLDIFKHALATMQETETETSSTSPTSSGNKPYALPWMPREYLSAFAFIPRYLEVNQNICAAVYLRHPVARPGSAEVPTPFPEGINANAFAWYLRRR